MGDCEGDSLLLGHKAAIAFDSRTFFGIHLKLYNSGGAISGLGVAWPFDVESTIVL